MQHWNFSFPSETISVQYCICWVYSYTVLWTFSKALEAKLMFFRTSVLVCEFSKASLWNSMVESVPSIWASCCSRRFFLFRANRAADTKKMKSCSLAPFVLIWLKPLELGIHKQQILQFLPSVYFKSVVIQQAMQHLYDITDWSLGVSHWKQKCLHLIKCSCF